MEALIFLGAIAFVAAIIFYILKAKPVRIVQNSAPEEKQNQQRSLKESLAASRFSQRIYQLFQSHNTSSLQGEIEEILYTSDLGSQTVERLMGVIGQHQDYQTIQSDLKTEFQVIFDQAGVPEPSSENALQYLNLSHHPSVWMIVGVNGAGKTTSIGKLAALLSGQGKRVLVAAGDTFRAAAGEQLKIWAERAGVEIFSPPGVTEPGAVVFDAIQKAKSGQYDVVLVDTAGRLHTQKNLMEELRKVQRVMKKAMPEAPHEVIIVLDANSGQNALVQARQFHEALGLTGVILTKMDGTAKGGIVVSVANELKIPIRFVGVGEKAGDLRAFSPREYIDSLLE